MAAYCSYFRSSTNFTMDCALYFSVDGSVLLILPLVKGFHNGLCAILLCRWQCIAHSYACQWLFQWFACRIAQWMATYCSYFCLSMAFTTVCPLYYLADGSRLLILPLINKFHNDLRTVLLCKWLSGWHYCLVVGSRISSRCR